MMLVFCLLFSLGLADAELTVSVITEIHSNGTSASKRTLPGSQPAVAYESLGAESFNVSGEAMRFRHEDWSCVSCPPKFVGNLTVASGKIAIGEPSLWGCGGSSVCGNQAWARALRDAGISVWVKFHEAASNPLVISGYSSRLLVAGEARGPEELGSFVLVDSLLLGLSSTFTPPFPTRCFFEKTVGKAT